jgi:hypothetical protein
MLRTTSRAPLVPTYPLMQYVWGILWQRVMCPENEADHLAPPDVDIYTWIFAAIPCNAMIWLNRQPCLVFFFTYGHAYFRNRVCISSTVTRLHGRRSGVCIPYALHMFLSPIESLQPTKPPIHLTLAAIFPWLKRQEHEVFQSHNLVLKLRICEDVCTTCTSSWRGRKQLYLVY